MKKILLYAALVILVLFNINRANAQGCVAIRSTGNACMMAHPDGNKNVKWMLATNFRYFKSFRHFSGTTENKARLEQGTQVINHSATMDINLFRILNDRWSVMVDMPILANSRSSLYEHGLVNGVNNYNER